MAFFFSPFLQVNSIIIQGSFIGLGLAFNSPDKKYAIHVLLKVPAPPGASAAPPFISMQGRLVKSSHFSMENGMFSRQPLKSGFFHGL